MTTDTGLVAHMHVLSEVASFDLLMEPGRPRSWNAVMPGNTLSPNGHHAVLCHAEGRTEHPGDWSAARSLATNFMEAYEYDKSAERPPLREAADRALRQLEGSNETLPTREQGEADIIAAAITTRGIDWLRVGDGTLLVRQPGQPIKALIEPTLQEENAQDEKKAKKPGIVLMTDTFAGRNGPEPIEKGTVLISASAGIQCLKLAAIERLVKQHQSDPGLLASALQRSVQARNPDLSLRTPSVTVCILQDPGR